MRRCWATLFVFHDPHPWARMTYVPIHQSMVGNRRRGGAVDVSRSTYMVVNDKQWPLRIAKLPVMDPLSIEISYVDMVGFRDQLFATVIRVECLPHIECPSSMACVERYLSAYCLQWCTLVIYRGASQFLETHAYAPATPIASDFGTY